MAGSESSHGDHARCRESRWRSSRLSVDLDDLDDLARKALFHLLVHFFFEAFIKSHNGIPHELHCHLRRFCDFAHGCSPRKETWQACNFR